MGIILSRHIFKCVSVDVDSLLFCLFVFYHYNINLKHLLHKIAHTETHTHTHYGQMCYICEAVAFSINTSANCPSRRNSELTVTFFEPGRIRKLLRNQRGQSLDSETG